MLRNAEARRAAADETWGKEAEVLMGPSGPVG